MHIPELHWPASALEYDQDLLLDVRAGAVVLLVRGRNAWNSTWVRHYLRQATLYTDVASARSGAEHRRGPGNVFYIFDAPAILLIGQSINVVLCDAHPDNPFGAFTGFSSTPTDSIYGPWVDGLFPGVSVRDAVRAFHHNSGHWSGPTPSEHSLRSGRLDDPALFSKSRRTKTSLLSRGIGGRYYLKWYDTEWGNRYTSRGAVSVEAEWKKITDPIDGLESVSDPAARAASLRQYREEVLKALPRSQWALQKAKAEAQRHVQLLVRRRNWKQAAARLTNIRHEMEQADAELRDAQRDQQTPASTSSGVRAQRLRVEAARSEIARLIAERETARGELDAALLTVEIDLS